MAQDTNNENKGAKSASERLRPYIIYRNQEHDPIRSAFGITGRRLKARSRPLVLTTAKNSK